MRFEYGNGTPISFIGRDFEPSEASLILINQGAMSGAFNDTTFKAPARSLLETAPHTFTSRGHSLEHIKALLDTHAFYGAEVTYGTFTVGMDLADAHWAIIEDTDTEPAIMISDRPCFPIPEIEDTKTPKGRKMAETYWKIHEAARTIPRVGMSKLDPDKDEILLMLAIRNTLNALRGTFTSYSFKNTEKIEDDMHNMWIGKALSASKKFQRGLGANVHNEKEFRYGDAGHPSQPALV